MSESDSKFAGSIPEVYESHMVPMLFAPYANAVAERMTRYMPGSLLEIAAGTGVVTRALIEKLPDTEITATDLNPAMLEVASRRGTHRPVTWKPANAQELPFKDGSFDAVVCQFGAMFFPDRVKAFREAGRVLRGGGYYLFTVWDRLESQPITVEAEQVFSKLLGRDTFLRRVPHGHFDPVPLKRELQQAGFFGANVETIALSMRAPSAKHAATAFCLGSPMYNELEELGPGTAEKTVDAIAEVLEKRFGSGPIEAPMSALLFTVGPV
jgi:ubiquinone/menaquinone biosynthesis C-methylase UbiE